MSYTQLLYHIVFRTKGNKKTINEQNEKELYAYIFGYIKNKKSILYRINGTENHIHLLIDLHPTLSLSGFMRDLKEASSKWLKQNSNFPMFEFWAEGYGAFTYSIKEKDTIINYIKNQKEHHKNKSFRDEYVEFLIKFDVNFDQTYVFEFYDDKTD